GLYACRIKCNDVAAAEQTLRSQGVNILSATQAGPGGKPVLWVEDAYGNPFMLHTSDDWFRPGTENIGGPSGCVIGVSDVEASQKFYADLLGYDTIVYDESGEFSDIAPLAGGSGRFRRMLITHSKPMRGPFSPMLGHTSLELIQSLDREAVKIFEGRLWGDLGYIHLCFDIQGMDALRERCAEMGHPFTVDSAAALGKSFDMGEAAGLFSYIEDPDGALIEFVETHKVPIAKKWNFYLNLQKRKDPSKPLPRWMLKAMALNRVKD
ncbi:MAG: VOC family protein, partial [Bacteroidota bacterium]